MFSVLALAAKEGSKFVFGYTGGGPTPFEVTQPQKEIVEVCTLSMLTGLLATCMTGSIMAVLIGMGLVVI